MKTILNSTMSILGTVASIMNELVLNVVLLLS